MKLKKILTLMCCAVLLVCISVGATVAYLTSTTGTVTNTFTSGKVAITLDEAPVDKNGEATDGDRVTANDYKLMPGHDYDKDPTIHVAATSEDCWLFVKVVNGIVAIESDAEGDDTIAKQMADNGWTAVAGENGVYAYESTVTGGTDVVVFETFTIDGDVKNEVLDTYEGATITVQAYAVQADNMATAAAAWTAAPLAAWQTDNETPAE